ncbi:MAG: hypothetical protein U1F87_00045 [Kiritimatiellia bacterium]
MLCKAPLLLPLLAAVTVSAQTTLNWRDPDATSGNWSGSNNWWNGGSAQAYPRDRNPAFQEQPPAHHDQRPERCARRPLPHLL